MKKDEQKLRDGLEHLFKTHRDATFSKILKHKSQFHSTCTMPAKKTESGNKLREANQKQRWKNSKNRNGVENSEKKIHSVSGSSKISKKAPKATQPKSFGNSTKCKKKKNFISINKKNVQNNSPKIPKSPKTQEKNRQKLKKKTQNCTMKKPNETKRTKSKLNENNGQLNILAQQLDESGSSDDSLFSPNTWHTDSDDYDDDDDTFEISSIDDYSSDEEYDSSTDEEYDSSTNEEYDSSTDDDSERDALIVHKGLAVKYDLELHHGVEFDDDENESHIIELPNQTSINTVKQPEAYNEEQLRILDLNFYQQVSISKLSKPEDDDDECPQLVSSVENDEHFKLWTSGVTMDDEMFDDCDCELEVEDSESSITSNTNVNEKYLKRRESFDSIDIEDEENHWSERTNMKAVIIEDKQKNSDGLNQFKVNFKQKMENRQNSLLDILALDGKPLESSEVKIIKGALENFGAKITKDENNFETLQNEELITTINGNVASSDMDIDVDEGSADTRNADTNDELEPEAEIDDIILDNENEDLKRQFDELSKDEISPKKCILTSLFCNSIDSYYVLVLMKSPFFIYGTVSAKLIAGSTEIYGYKLKTDEIVTIYSPRGCCAIPLKPTPSVVPQPSNLTKDEMKEKIIAEIQSLSDVAEFNIKEVKEIISSFDPPNDAILLLTRNEAAIKIKHIFQQHVNENIFPAHIPQSRPLFSTELMLDCMINPTHENSLQIPSQWSDMQLNENSKLMIVGGKSVGKSTFLRYLLNKHLDKFPKILLIDLDIGQPEIFLPQTVSCALLDKPLLGPGFFYQYEPEKAFAVGHTNLTLCAHAYMRAVVDLLNFCKSQSAYSKVPWLINTMGYNKGFGGELISVISSHIRPTDIIQLQSNKPINNFDILFEKCMITKIPRNIYNTIEYECSENYQPDHQLYVMNSAILQQSRYQQEWQMSAKDLRYMMLLARLSAILPDEGEWINCSETFCRNLEELQILNLVAPNSDALQTLKSLESSLVYLCNVDITSSSSLSEPPDEATGLTRKTSPECLGLGIVRAIDYQAKQIFILPAMPIKKLSYVNCLALGEMPLPSSLLIEQNPDSKFNVPFVQVMNNLATSRSVKQFFYRT